MRTHRLLSVSWKVSGCFMLLAFAMLSTPSASQVSNASFSGTYTLVFGTVDEFLIQQNMFGQEVGFCSAATQLPFGYSCNTTLSASVVTGTLVADGAGNIVTGSSYVFTADVNRYKCSSHYKATPDCPYKVPSGIAWSSSISYVVGDEVDFTVNGTPRTFQAVKNNTNVAPSGSLCTATIQPPNCTWVQLYVSATGQAGATGTLTGKYSVQSNGSGLLQLTPSGQSTVSFSMVVPAAPLAVGQEVPLVAIPTLGREFRGSGSAVRVK